MQSSFWEGAMPLFFNKANPVLVAGIINLSPDSFYGDSRCDTESAALKKAEQFACEGADMLDVGAESSRPGSQPIPSDLELVRLLPVVSSLRKSIGIPLSVDTCKPGIAERVLDKGVEWINDITGLQKHADMAPLIARYKAGVIMMHMQGTPATMQDNPQYQDLIGEIIQYLKRSIAIAESAGIASDRMIIDPGVGFGKTVEHNLELLRRLDEFKVLNKPLLLGVSRKAFIGNVLGLPVDERLEGSLAAAVIGVMKGVRILRVHDVKETVRAVKMAQVIMNSERGER